MGRGQVAPAWDLPPATRPVAEGGRPSTPALGAQAGRGGGNCIGKNAEEEKCIRGGFLNTFQDGRTWRRLLAVSCCGGSPVFVEVLLPCEQRGNVGSSAKRGNWLVL